MEKNNVVDREVLISVVVPCFKQAQFLDECLQSVISQTFQGWECIIVDDASPDNTHEIAQKWVKKDRRFEYLSKKENQGLSAARNSGIAFAKGEIILPLDADDYISPDYLSLAVAEFKKNDSVKVVYGKGWKFGIEEGYMDLTPYNIQGLCKSTMLYPASFFKKKDWEEVGGYDVNMIYGWEDWEFWISLLKNGGEVVRIEEICFYYRIKKNSMLKSIDAEKATFLTDYISVKHADIYVKTFGSFFKLDQKIKNQEIEFENKLRSEKFLIDLFLKRIFGFTIFGKYKK